MTKYLCPICKHFCFDQKIEQTFCYLNGTTADKYVKTLAISNERVRCKHCDHLLDRHELKEFHKYVDKDENVDYGLMEEVELLKNNFTSVKYPVVLIEELAKGE